MRLSPTRLPIIDPRQLGARCDQCPLVGRIPVKAEPNPSAQIIWLGEAPGKNEEREGRNFIGESGKLVDRICAHLGVPRAKALVTNAIMCRPDKNLSPAEWRQALDCCRPRLIKEVESTKAKVVLALGKRALQTTTGKAQIFDWMGAPLESGDPKAKKDQISFPTGYQILPTLHPAHILRQPEWNPVLVMHFGRAYSLVTGQLKPWKWPRCVVGGPDLGPALKSILKSKLHCGVDVETGGIDPLKDVLLNVGIANADVMVSVQWQEAGTETKELAARILADGQISKDMHNGQFDVLSLTSNNLPVAGYDFDSRIAHAVCAPRLKHSLSVVTAIEFHAPRWKTQFRATSDQAGANRFIQADPIERAVYNARDSYMTSLLRDRLLGRIHKRVHNGQAQLDQYMALNEQAIQMRRLGVMTDQGQFESLRRSLTRRRHDARNKLKAIAAELGCAFIASPEGDRQEYNPNSNPHVRHIFLTKLGITPRAWSEKTGAPKFDEKVLLDLCASQSDLVSRAARHYLQYRRWTKLLKTYVIGLKGLDRVHPDWNPSGARTGRWACSNPNLMNIPKAQVVKVSGTRISTPNLRCLFRSRPGKFLIEADYKQLEAYILWLLSGDEKLGELLKGDIHSETAKPLFGYTDETWDKSDKVCASLRDLAKRGRYAMHYGAKAETAWRALVVDFPKLALSDVIRMFNQFGKMHPKIVSWQQTQLELARGHDYIEAPISGRRYYFHGIVEPNKCYNLPIQMTAADIINAAMLRLVPRLAKSESILLQVHDSLVCEGPNPKRLASLVRQEMEREVELNGTKVRFMVDLKFGTNWGRLEELKLNQERNAAQ